MSAVTSYSDGALFLRDAIGHDPGDELTKDEAIAVTARIKAFVGVSWLLLVEAHERKAHKAMGFATWGDYVEAEFDMSRSRSYQLISQARVVRELSAAVSTDVDVSEAVARDLAPVLDEAKAAAVEAVEALPHDATDADRAQAAQVAVQTVRERVINEKTTTVTFDASTGEIVGDASTREGEEGGQDSVPPVDSTSPASAPTTDGETSSSVVGDEDGGGGNQAPEGGQSPAAPPPPVDPRLLFNRKAGQLISAARQGIFAYEPSELVPALDPDHRALLYEFCDKAVRWCESVNVAAGAKPRLEVVS